MDKKDLPFGVGLAQLEIERLDERDAVRNTEGEREK